MELVTIWCRKSAAAVLFALFGMSASLAQTPPAGQLKCDVEGGFSYILGSSRGLDCVYTPDAGIPEYYKAASTGSASISASNPGASLCGV